MMFSRKLLLPSLALLAMAAVGSGQKKPLDHSVYDGWKSISRTSVTDDGKWMLFTISPQEGDAVSEVRSIGGGTVHKIERASSIQFSQDGKFVVATIVPKDEDVKKARREKKKPEDMPKNGLLILNLETGQRTELQNITSFTLAEDDSGYLLYKPEPPKPAPATPAAQPAASGQAQPGEKKEEPKKEEPKKKSDHRPGDPYVLRHLATGAEERLENVVTARFIKDGSVLVYALSTKDGADDGIIYYDLKKKERQNVVKGLGRYSRLAVHDDTKRVLFATDKDDYAAKTPAQTVYLWSPGDKEPRLIAKAGTDGIPKDWIIAESGGVRFSKSGNRVFFPTKPKPAEEKKDDTPEEDKVQVDIWNWKDPMLQPQQLLQATAERNRTYEAIYFLDNRRVVQLETPQLNSVVVAKQGDGDFGLANDDAPYRQSYSWGDWTNDVYVVDVRSGKAKKVIENLNGGASLSTDGRYVAGWDAEAQELFAIDARSGKKTILNKDIPHPVWDEIHDTPDRPSSYGIAGWTKDDRHALVYDNFDIWVVDMSGGKKPYMLTEGVGRITETRFRYQNIDPETPYVKEGEPLLLVSLNNRNKNGGYYTDVLGASGSPKKLIEGPKRYTRVTDAKDADVRIFTQQDFVEYPDLWVGTKNFTNAQKVSDANPQQKDYNWGTAELVQYTSLDGVELQGILIKPEDFNPAKKYPMIAYFYERDSDTLHQHRVPSPSASTVNLPMYASNGYVLFIPDIPYKEGYPGESAINAILPGVQTVINKGFVDPKKVGIQGQSWGGYQVAYMITESNMFAAACAGAPVANMFSAYGGIRWGSGLVRQFQYEKGQSRIAASIWEKPLRYLENSPIFFADKVKTPLLMMHNDKDGAVPWYQGVEYFTALRRLNKPVWLAVYNNEDHNLVQRKNRKDWSVRMQQFFDHYLKGAPMPVWMSQGIPATEKGKTYGFETPAPANTSGNKSGN